MCSTEQFIRDSAAKGLSRTQTRHLLGVSYRRFSVMLEYLPDIKWPPKGNSRANRLANAERRGTCSEALRAANRSRGRAMWQHTLDGVTGSLAELVTHFKCPASVRTVERRLDAGMDLRTALTKKPIQPFKGPNHRVGWTAIKRTSK